VSPLQEVNSSNDPEFPATAVLRVACLPAFAADPVSVGARQTHKPTASTKKDLQMQAFSRAADGIRTHDLLHGKQTL
jgi:hypothetical protein